jgi:hypothetical protein
MTTRQPRRRRAISTGTFDEPEAAIPSVRRVAARSPAEVLLCGRQGCRRRIRKWLPTRRSYGLRWFRVAGIRRRGIAEHGRRGRDDLVQVTGFTLAGSEGRTGSVSDVALHGDWGHVEGVLRIGADATASDTPARRDQCLPGASAARGTTALRPRSYPLSSPRRRRRHVDGALPTPCSRLPARARTNSEARIGVDAEREDPPQRGGLAGFRDPPMSDGAARAS